MNGKPVDRPSFLLRPDDVFEIKPTKLKKPVYSDLQEELVNPREGFWLQREGKEGFRFKVTRLPMHDEAEQGFDPAFIVEFYSKFV